MSDIEYIKNMELRIQELENKLKETNSEIKQLKIDNQNFVKRNNDILPGISPKVVYNNEGLIVRGEKLTKVDIPNLDIDHIEGLRDQLNNKVNKTDLTRLKSLMDESIPKKSKIVNTGTKINYDTNGFIISSTELNPDDIPNLPIEKINGLKDALELQSSESCDEKIEHPNINGDTFIKVTTDIHGHVIQGSKLTINDIPSEIMSSINSVESQLTKMASQQSVDILTKQVTEKLDSNPPITSGIFTKVIVDSNGLIKQGSRLSIDDLPSISIENINGLTSKLNNKVDYNQLTQFNNELSNISGIVSKLGDPNQLKKNIDSKVSVAEVAELRSQVNEIQVYINQLKESIPIDMIDSRLTEINNILDSLNNRIANLENMLNK